MNRDEREKFLELLGKLQVTSGEEADCVVCRLVSTPLYFPDNQVGNCTRCHRMIQFRPHAPKGPPKVCDECAIKNMAKDGSAEVVITPQSLGDLRLYLKKKSEH